MSMTPDAILAKIRSLASNIDGTEDGRYDVEDFGQAVLEVLREQFGCCRCGADISEGRGGSYKGKKYHIGCMPNNLDLSKLNLK